MNRLVLTAVFVLGALGCGRKDDVQFQKQPGLLDPQGNPIVAPTVPPTPPVKRQAPVEYDVPRAPDPLPPPVAAVSVDAAVEDAAAAPPRDLAAELSALLPRITSCVDLPAAAAQRDGRLVISVSAVVLGTGRVSRASVTAAGQPAAALGCLEREAQNLALAENVPGAPLSVKGSTELTIKPARSALGDAAVAAPIPVAPTIPVTRDNPDLAQPQADDVAKPEIDSLAGPP